MGSWLTAAGWPAAELSGLGSWPLGQSLSLSCSDGWEELRAQPTQHLQPLKTFQNFAFNS